MQGQRDGDAESGRAELRDDREHTDIVGGGTSVPSSSVQVRAIDREPLASSHHAHGRVMAESSPRPADLDSGSSGDRRSRRDSSEALLSRPETRVLIVSTDAIVAKIAPLCSLKEDQLKSLIESYDQDQKGGLSELQWAAFCKDNRKHFAALGVEMLVFDGSGEYSLVTVEKAGDSVRPVTLSRPTQSVVHFLESFAAGGIAGAVSKTVIAPGDRVKIIFQVDSSRRFSLLEAVRLGGLTIKQFGLTGLWIGNGATMLRVVPYAAITYVSFDSYHHILHPLLMRRNADGTLDERKEVSIRFLCGSLAGATSTTCTYPLDLMRARFAARSSTKQRFPTYREAFRESIASQGARSLYGGLFPTLVGIVPYAGCSFACFETLKRYLVEHQQLESERDISTVHRLLAGGLSGLIAQSVTYPLDIVRRRMQVTPRRYKGVVHALGTIFREEGLRQGMYKGLSMNWIKGPIATATSFTVNDLIKRRTRNYYDTAVERSHRRDIVTLPEALLCGGIAAGVAKLWTLPLDRLKIMYQLGVAESRDFSSAGLARLFGMLRKKPNLWGSGHTVMIRVIPYGALTYSLFDVFQLPSERIMYVHEPNPLTNAVAGAAAAAVGTFLVYPLDLLRTRSAVSSAPRFQSYFWLFRGMARRNGIASLWEGCYLAMMGVGALAGVGFASYEYLKDRFKCDTFGKRLVAGMAAGIAGQVLTYPLNVAKRCRQAEYIVLSRTAMPLVPLSLHPGMYAALYRKMPFSFALGSFTFGISFAVNDACRDLISSARKDILYDMFFSAGATSQA